MTNGLVGRVEIIGEKNISQTTREENIYEDYYCYKILFVMVKDALSIVNLMTETYCHFDTYTSIKKSLKIQEKIF